MNEERLTRREYLLRGAGAVLAASAAAAGGYLLYDRKGDAGLPASRKAEPRRLKNYFASIDLPASNPRLSIATGGLPGARGTAAAIEKLVRAAVGGLDPALRIKRFIAANDVVLIKPNVGFDRPPHLGATTNPEVLRWVIRLCKEAGARQVLVADNPIESPEACFAKSGLRQVADAEGATIVLPAEDRFETLTIREPDGPTIAAPAGDGDRAAGLPDRWPVLYGPLAQATKLIGIAPIKDHSLCSASMNLKNWYGLLGGRRNQFHQAIHEVVSDLALLFSPTLVIADATRVMMRNGPTGGRTSDVQPGGVLGRPAVIASVDPVACDAWCYEKLLGRDPTQLAYLALAAKKIESDATPIGPRFGECNWRMYQTREQIAVFQV